MKAPVTGFLGSPDVFCIQLVDFWGIVLDYESLAVLYGSRRHLLNLKEFRFLEALLWAEGGGISTQDLADACGIPQHRFRRDLLNRISYRLRREVLVDQTIAVAHVSGNLWRLKRA